MSYDWDVMSRGLAALFVEDQKPNSTTRSLTKKERKRWAETAGLARLATERYFEKQRSRRLLLTSASHQKPIR